MARSQVRLAAHDPSSRRPCPLDTGCRRREQMTGSVQISLRKLPARRLSGLPDSARKRPLEYRVFQSRRGIPCAKTGKRHTECAYYERNHCPISYSGLPKVGIVKSDAKTRVVLPPLVGVIVPESTRIASGSPCRLCST